MQKYNEMETLIKTRLLDVLGFGVNNNIIYNDETFEQVAINGKILVFEQMPEYTRNFIELNIMDAKIISSMFKKYIQDVEEQDGLYVMTFYEKSMNKKDPFAKTALECKDREMNILSSDYYYIPILKYLDIMYRISEMYKVDELLQVDNQQYVIDYYTNLEKEKALKRRRRS